MYRKYLFSCNISILKYELVNQPCARLPAISGSLEGNNSKEIKKDRSKTRTKMQIKRLVKQNHNERVASKLPDC